MQPDRSRPPLAKPPGSRARSAVRVRRRASCLLGTALLALTCSTPSNAATIVVQNGCSLSNAITAANEDRGFSGCPAGDPGQDTIVLTTDVALSFAHSDAQVATGLPSVTSEIVIEGNHRTLSRIPSAPAFRFFHVWHTGRLTLNFLHLDNGESTVSGGALYNDVGYLVLNNCVISNSRATERGGGIYNDHGRTELYETTVTGNRADRGGGVANEGGKMFLTRSTLADNDGGRAGGGAYNPSGETRLGNSTASGNQAEKGGGVFNAAGTVRLDNATLADNRAEFGANVYNSHSSGVIEATNSLFGFPDTSNCVGLVDDLGGNLADDASCGRTIGHLNGLARPLADNGGPTPTHALQANSTAVSAAATCAFDTDQRGVRRLPAADCDSGAFEIAAAPDPVPATSWFGTLLLLTLLPSAALARLSRNTRGRVRSPGTR